MGLIMAHQGESERALTVLSECSERGFSSAPALIRNPWFNSLHSTAQFKNLLKTAEAHLGRGREGLPFGRRTANIRRALLATVYG